MSWMTVDQINSDVDILAATTLARWPKSNVQPEAFGLGESQWYIKGAAGAYPEGFYPIKALKIPSRVRGKEYEGSLDHLSVIITGGVLGNELIGPDAALHFAKLFLDAVKHYQKVDSSQGITVPVDAQDIRIPAISHGGAAGYFISHTDLEEILEMLNIWIVPLVNPGGRDEQLRVLQQAQASVGALVPAQDTAGRPNPAGVCINRNFDVGWHFKQLFSDRACRTFQNSMSPTTPDYYDPALDYQGAQPESERETQALVRLLCKDVHVPTGDPSITWLFDLHGQRTFECNVSYPWSWAQNQSQHPAMCLGNPQYDPPQSAQHPVVRDGIVDLTQQPAAYGEYMPPKTAADLSTLANAFTAAARQTSVMNWSTPGQGAKTYPCVGAIDDYFMWLDRNHCRAFTVECAALQPNDGLRGEELDMVAAGLFEAIKQIKNWVKASSNPQEDLSRLSKNQLSCP